MKFITPPLVSIIIPIYNDAKFLHECLDSAVNQTLKNIEIICVNDASTDNSLEIMNEYAAKDSRVRIVNKKENGGTLMARKDGVMAANGIFTMFMDHDDNLVPNACETAYNLIVQNDVDILWFSYFRYIYDEYGKLSNICVQNPLYNGILYGRDQIQGIDKGGAVALWNKIFKTALVKKAYHEMDNFYCIYFEDNYADYYISYYAQTLLGISTEPLYTHYFGRGITGNNKISLELFEKMCRIKQAVNHIKNFLEREGTLAEQEKYLSRWNRNRRNYCCYVFCRRVKTEDFDQAVKILYSYFNDKEDAEEITLNLLTRSRNQAISNKQLEDSLKTLQNQEKDARIKELQNWNAEQLKAKEWFLSQISNKDARIAELQKNRSLFNKFRRAIAKLLKKLTKFF